MCEFHESTCNGFGDIWWTDNPIYFSSIDDQKPTIVVLCLRGIIEVTPTLHHISAYDLMSPLSGKYALFMPKIVPTYNQTQLLSFRNESRYDIPPHSFSSLLSWKRTYFRPLNYVEFVERSLLSVELCELGFFPRIGVCMSGKWT